MKKLLAFVVLLLASTSQAAVINRTYTYTDGNSMSANENNTNENTIYTEFNGNIESANIKDGTIANGDLADTQIAVTKFASNVQSTFTYVNTLGNYRRPVLKWISITTVDVEANTGTSNQTCIQFPDQQRCVTENTGSTSVNRRFIITETASVSGTKNSGLFAGEVEGFNLWYALYAVKTTDVSTDFVIIGTTKTPEQANYATLNTNFGTNGWVYLGMIRNGDNSASTSDILRFFQTGAMTQFTNVATGSGLSMPGTILASNTSTTLTYNFTSGVGTTDIPGHLPLNWFTGQHVGAGSGTVFYKGGASQAVYFALTEVSAIRSVATVLSSSNDSFQIVASNSAGNTIQLSGYMDGALGVGYNPQL